MKISKFEVKASLPYQNNMSDILLNVPDEHIGRSHKHAYSLILFLAMIIKLPKSESALLCLLLPLG